MNSVHIETIFEWVKERRFAGWYVIMCELGVSSGWQKVRGDEEMSVFGRRSEFYDVMFFGGGGL